MKNKLLEVENCRWKPKKRSYKPKRAKLLLQMIGSSMADRRSLLLPARSKHLHIPTFFIFLLILFLFIIIYLYLFIYLFIYLPIYIINIIFIFIYYY